MEMGEVSGHRVPVPADASAAERRLLKALQRVVDGDVVDPRNLAAKQVDRLELTQETVAFEDGRNSRIPLCGSTARYPRVRDAILEAQRLLASASAGDMGVEGGRGRPDADDRKEIADLRRRLAEAEERMAVAHTTAAAAVILLRKTGAELAALRQKPSDRAARRREAEARLPDYS